MANDPKNRLARAAKAGAPERAREGERLMCGDMQGMDSNRPMRVRRRSTGLPAALALLAGLVGAGQAALAREPTAAFAMPADFGQWRPDAFVHNAYRFRQADGNCVVTFIQNRGADAARAAGREPRHSLDAYVEGVKARMERVERAEVDAFELSSGPDQEKVRFVADEIAYVGQDHIEYHNRISAAWVDDVELVIVAACPASEWLAGRQSIDALVNKVTITRLGNP